MDVGSNIGVRMDIYDISYEDAPHFVPGVPILVGVCEECGKLYVSERITKRGHRLCLQRRSKRRQRGVSAVYTGS